MRRNIKKLYNELAYNRNKIIRVSKMTKLFKKVQSRTSVVFKGL